MKNLQHILLTVISLLLLCSCSDILDVEPVDKIQGEQLFSDPEGVRLYMANLYSQLPTEDFTFFRDGFDINSGDPNNAGFASAMLTDNAVHSQFNDFMRNEDFAWWVPGYALIRDVNLLIDELPNVDLLETEREQVMGEASFIRGYAYFALAKRYGGAPIIKTAQEFEENIESLRVPRSTSQETWDFILNELTVASENLPSGRSSDERRATKWAALALKSRAALHAASIAKYNDELPLSGTAVDNGLIGLSPSLADTYYEVVIESSEAIINSGQFSLYEPNPGSVEEAAENIRRMFQDPNIATEEAIFIKGYAMPGNERGHNYDIWYQPAQLANGWPHPGRMNPTLDLVDHYETYDAPGEIVPVETTVSGNTEDYSGYDPGESYLRFSDPQDLFANRDARFHAAVVPPGSEWKNMEIIIQAGFVKPDGEAVIMTQDQYSVNGETYYTYGASGPSLYSGFDTFGGNNTRSGFSFKKFLDETESVTPAWNQSTTDFMVLRYAEVLLNYAEAVVESGMGNANLAETALNDIRKRAAHTVDVDLTLENVLRERRVELAFENRRYWDLIRRREYEDEFNNRRMRTLMPLIDLRSDPPQYIFVRTTTPNLPQRNFDPQFYYRPIPGISGNGLIQNPQY